MKTPTSEDRKKTVDILCKIFNNVLIPMQSIFCQQFRKQVHRKPFENFHPAGQFVHLWIMVEMLNKQGKESADNFYSNH